MANNQDDLLIGILEGSSPLLGTMSEYISDGGNGNSIEKIIPLGAFSLFPTEGYDKHLYIDMSENALYRWDRITNEYVLIDSKSDEIEQSRSNFNRLGDRLGRMAYYFDTVEDIKACMELKAGDKCWALGTEVIQDDLTRIYKVSSSGDVPLAAESVHKLGNGLYIYQLASVSGTGGSGGVVGNITLLPISPLSTTVAEGGSALLKYSVSTESETLTTAKYYVDGIMRHTEVVTNGDVSLNVTNYIKKGMTTIEVRVSDQSGGKRSLFFIFNTVSISITSSFNSNLAFSGDIDFRYTPNGNTFKTVHFEVDGSEVYTSEVSTSGVQVSQIIAALPHGEHHLSVYLSINLDGVEILSNRLEYTFICIESGRTDIVIASSFLSKPVTQGEIINIPYKIYNPSSESSGVTLRVNGVVKNTLIIDRSLQNWNLTSYPKGSVEFEIRSGEASRIFTVLVNAVSVNVEAVTEGLELHLTPSGRSNFDLDRDTWAHNDVTATLTDFDFVGNGWIVADDGENVLRLYGDARVNIPYDFFGKDLAVTGSTIEIEFTTRKVSDIDTIIMSCMHNNIGIEITPQIALLSTESLNKVAGKAVTTKYKENERLRVSFVIQPRSSNRLVYIYLDGIISGLIQYPTIDNFEQAIPKGLTIGTNYAEIDIHTIRQYNFALEQSQMIGNYIADKTNVVKKIELFRKNDIFNSYNEIDYNKVVNLIPCMTIIGKLPTYKGDKRDVIINYENAEDPSRNIDMQEKVSIDVQGTSSQFYPRKNFKLKFSGQYKLRSDSIPEKTFTIKADYMESSHAHNIGNDKILNDLLRQIHLYPPQVNNTNIRSTIDGCAMTVFHQETLDSTKECIGAYNFNNDSSNYKILGVNSGDEIWEFCDNSALRCSFKAWRDTNRAISSDFEARYPKDYDDYTKLERVIRWTASTAEDIEKFENEFDQYWHKDSVISYYVIAEALGLIDSMAKNLFISTYGDDGIWYAMWYDLDTCYGLNNEGVLTFGYGIEYHDRQGTKQVYNGEESILWNNLEIAYPDAIKDMYVKMRGNGLDYDNILSYLKGQQIDLIPEALYNYDTQFKYINPLMENNDGTYLYIAQGSREHHLKWWLENRLSYLDSKYDYGEYRSEFASMRLYKPSGNLPVAPDATFNITSYGDQYVSILFGSITKTIRVKKGVPASVIPASDDFNDTECAIYGAPMLSDIGDLSSKYPDTVDITRAVKLNRLIIGSSVEGYQNTNLRGVSIGNNTLLREINVMNCPSLTQAIDVSGCNNIKEVYAVGSSISTIILPKGAKLDKVHLPETITSLSLINNSVADLFITGHQNITTLRVEDVDSIKIDIFEIFNGAINLNWIRLIGVDWNIENPDVLDWLAAKPGKDANNVNIAQSVITGKCAIGRVTERKLWSLRRRFPGLSLTAVELIYDYAVIFLDWDDSVIEIQKMAYGEFPENPFARQYNALSTPVRDTDDLYVYEYIGWDKEFLEVQSNTNVRATYAETEWFTVEFKDWDGSILDTQRIIVGENAENPIVRPSNPISTPTRLKDGSSYYTYSDWSRPFSNIQENVVVTALYDQVDWFAVIFINFDGTVLDIQDILDGHNADDPVTRLISPIGKPSKSKDSNYFYEYSGWDKPLTNIRAGITVTAMFNSLPWQTVTFMDWDNSVLDIQRVYYGGQANDPITRSVNPIAAPNRPTDSITSYRYDGWQQPLVDIVKNTIIKAKYIGLKEYTVTFKDWDGSLLETQIVNVFESAINPITRDINPMIAPTKARDDTYVYTYGSWDRQLANITSDITVTAIYSRIAWFMVTFKDWDGSILDTQEILISQDASNPITRIANPISTPFRDKDAYNHYAYSEWDKPLGNIQSNRVVTATYTSTSWFTVMFADWNGSLLDSQEVLINHSASDPITRDYNPIDTPLRARDNYNYYMYSGWDTAFNNIQSDITVKAIYDGTPWYIVSFVDWNNEVLDSQEVLYGEDAEDPLTRLINPIDEPFRVGDDLAYSYRFDGWNKFFSNIKSNTTVTAKLMPSFIVKFYSEDRPIQASILEYGETAIFTGDETEIYTVKRGSWVGQWADSSHTTVTDFTVTDNISYYAEFDIDSEHLVIPEFDETKDQINILVKIQNDDTLNTMAFEFLGSDYTVDWGDGDIQNYSSYSTSVEHNYVWLYTSPNTLTSKGFKQAWIKIEAARGNLTSINLHKRHSESIGNFQSSILEIRGNVEGYDNISIQKSFNSIVTHDSLELFELHGTSGVIDIHDLFHGCNKLREIASLDTNSVTNMNGSFKNCGNLVAIPSLDTSGVNDMGGMFHGCHNITAIPLLDTAKVINMNEMFYGCHNITAIPLLDTAKVINMNEMFRDCLLLKEIPIINTAAAINMNGMFHGCSSLKRIPLIDVGNTSDIHNMFYGCSILETLNFVQGTLKTSVDLSNLSLSPESIDAIFNQMAMVDGFKTITITGNPGDRDCDKTMATSKGWTVISGYNVVVFKSPDGTILDVQKLMSGHDAVDPITREINPISTPAMIGLVFKTWDRILTGITEDVVIYPVFVRTNGYLTIPEFDNTKDQINILTKVFDDDALNFVAFKFNVINSDYTVDWGDGTISHFESGNSSSAEHSYIWNNTPSGSLTSQGFKQSQIRVSSGRGSITDIDFHVRHSSKDQLFITPILEIRANVQEYNSLYLQRYESPLVANSNIELFEIEGASAVTDMSALFTNCTSLKTVAFSDTGNVRNMSRMFINCSALTIIPLLNTSEVLDMSSMLYGCSGLITFPLLNTSKVSDMTWLFYGCKSMKSIPLIDASSATEVSLMFNSCTSLNDLNFVQDSLKASFDLIDCDLSSLSLNTILDQLPTVTESKTVTITGNPGASACDTSIATVKGWVVITL